MKRMEPTEDRDCDGTAHLFDGFQLSCELRALDR